MLRMGRKALVYMAPYESKLQYENSEWKAICTSRGNYDGLVGTLGSSCMCALPAACVY